MTTLTFTFLMKGFNIPDSSRARLYECGIENISYHISKLPSLSLNSEPYFINIYDTRNNEILYVDIVSSNAIHKLNKLVEASGSIKNIGSSYFIVLDSEVPKKVPVEKKAGTFVMPRIIACDFDGCIALNHIFPECGDANWTVINMLKNEMKNGSKIILNTCREGKALENAVAFCEYHGIRLDAVNGNLPEVIEYFGDPRKIIATEYWDDKAVNVGVPDPVLCDQLIVEWANRKQQSE